MILKIFTKDDGPQMRQAIELGQKLETEDYEVEYYDSEEMATTQLLELYDVYNFPTFVVTTEAGTPVETWRGQVALESDLKAFLNG